MTERAVWYCKVGYADRDKLPDAADLPIRRAVERAFLDMVGEPPDFMFTGWGGHLNPYEEALVHEKDPVVGLEVALEVVLAKFGIPLGFDDGSDRGDLASDLAEVARSYQEWEVALEVSPRLAGEEAQEDRGAEQAG